MSYQTYCMVINEMSKMFTVNKNFGVLPLREIFWIINSFRWNHANLPYHQI